MKGSCKRHLVEPCELLARSHDLVQVRLVELLRRIGVELPVGVLDGLPVGILEEFPVEVLGELPVELVLWIDVELPVQALDELPVELLSEFLVELLLVLLVLPIELPVELLVSSRRTGSVVQRVLGFPGSSLDVGRTRAGWHLDFFVGRFWNGVGIRAGPRIWHWNGVSNLLASQSGVDVRFLRPTASFI